MKSLLTAIISLVLPVSLSALPIGNPSEPANFFENTFETSFLRYGDPCGRCYNFRLGYYGDFVYDRHLRVHQSGNESYFSRARMATNAASFTLNLMQILDLYATLGATNFTLVGMGKSFSPSTPPGFLTTLNTVSHFSWSVGARTLLYVYQNTVFGGGVQYFSCDPHVSNIGRVYERTSPPSSVNLDYSEVQASLAISHLFAFCGSPISLIPYIGAKYARVFVDTQRITFPSQPGVLVSLPGHIENARKFGYAVGATMRVYGNLGVTVEGQWMDENAVSVTGQLRY